MEFTAIKGFKDILPDESGYWQRVEAVTRKVFRDFGYREFNPPLMERTELFSRSIGEETDIVSKQMYTLTDSKGRGMTLRPEATASLVRANIEHKLYNVNPVQKLFTLGPMFRRERPQKGRFRQFHQIDAEIFGDFGPRSDADLIVMAMFLLRSIGLTGLSLQINSLGNPDCRAVFREKLMNYLSKRSGDLCSDCQRRAELNPMRVFDCKVQSCQEVVSEAPSILDYICKDCQTHFATLQEYLDIANIPFTVNHKLVRGLDYYTRTTFEIQTDRLGAQNAVTGGGRYDVLFKQLGGPDYPAIGFAMGIERIVALLEEERKQENPSPDLFVAALGDEAERKAFLWANQLREAGLWIETEFASKGLKAQMKRAGRLGAKRVLIVGEDELASGKAVLRDMETKVQSEVGLDRLMDELKNTLRCIGPEK